MSKNTDTLIRNIDTVNVFFSGNSNPNSVGPSHTRNGARGVERKWLNEGIPMGMGEGSHHFSYRQFSMLDDCIYLSIEWKLCIVHCALCITQ